MCVCMCIYITKVKYTDHFYTLLKLEVQGTEAKSVLYYSTKCLQNLWNSHIPSGHIPGSNWDIQNNLFTKKHEVSEYVKISRKLTRWQSHYSGFQTLWKKIVETFFFFKKEVFYLLKSDLKQHPGVGRKQKPQWAPLHWPLKHCLSSKTPRIIAQNI